MVIAQPKMGFFGAFRSSSLLFCIASTRFALVLGVLRPLDPPDPPWPPMPPKANPFRTSVRPGGQRVWL